MTIIDQKKLADLVHDSDLRLHLTHVVESLDLEDSTEVRVLREYLEHTGVGTHVPLTRPRTLPVEEDDK